MKTLFTSFYIFLLTTTSLQAQINQPSELKQINYNGISRQYLLNIPPNHDLPLPLVIVLHGNNGTGANIEEKSQFSQEARKSNFIVAYPYGLNRTWDKTQDIGFLQAVVADIQVQVSVDINKLYFVGHSLGGGMASKITCAWNQIKAFADVSHVLSYRDKNDCINSPPHPALFLHGTNDPISPYTGDWNSLSSLETAKFWADKYKPSNYTTTKTNLTIESGRTYLTNVYTYNSPVQLYSLTLGGHPFPSDFPSPYSSSQGHTVTKIGFQSGAHLIWNFLKLY